MNAQFDHEPVADERETLCFQAFELETFGCLSDFYNFMAVEAFAFVNQPGLFVFWGWFIFHQFGEPFGDWHTDGKSVIVKKIFPLVESGLQRIIMAFEATAWGETERRGILFNIEKNRRYLHLEMHSKKNSCLNIGHLSDEK